MTQTPNIQSNRNNTTDKFPSAVLPSSSSNGLSRFHNLIASNAAIAIGSRIHGGRAEMYVNGMCVQLGRDMTAFPSIVVVNGEPSFANGRSDVLENPTCLIDVISNEVDAAGRAQRLESYLAIPSTKECLLVRVDEMRIEHYARQNAKQWIYRIYDGRDDVVSLDSISCKLSVAEFYAQVKLRHPELSSKAVN